MSMSLTLVKRAPFTRSWLWMVMTLLNDGRLELDQGEARRELQSELGEKSVQAFLPTRALESIESGWSCQGGRSILAPEGPLTIQPPRSDISCEPPSR